MSAKRKTNTQYSNKVTKTDPSETGTTCKINKNNKNNNNRQPYRIIKSQHFWKIKDML